MFSVTRANRGLQSIESHGCIMGEPSDDLRTTALDLVTDVLHALAAEGIDGELVLVMAQRHFEAERREEA